MTPGDERVSRLVSLSASLAVGDSPTIPKYGPWVSLAVQLSREERPLAIAELDALASLLYEVSDEHLELIFNRVDRSPITLVRRFREQWQGHHGVGNGA
jgi:hypothetical protein